MGLTSVDALQQLIWVTFVLEVDQIFVISVNSNVGVGSPSSLDLFSSELIFGLEFNLLFSLEITSPSPLNLDCCNVVHRKSMIFEKSSRKRHFVCGLNDGSTEISQALIFILVHNIEWRGQEFLPEFLSRG